MAEHSEAPFHPSMDTITLETVLQALADTVRLGLVQELATEGPVRCSSYNAKVGLAKSTMSHHYRILRESGILLVTIDGRERIVDLRRDDLDARFPGLLGAVIADAGGREASRG